MSLQKISMVIVPRDIIEDTFAFIRAFGMEAMECQCLWAGNIKGSIFTVREIIFPQHDSSMISYYIDADELDRVNRYLHSENFQLISQIHSHPTMAFHSDTDDQFPIITTLGGFSIVVPDFGFVDSDVLINTSIFRLKSTGWVELSKGKISSIFKIVDS